MLISYVFRGEEVDIDVTDKREPYEWLFFGVTVDEHNALAITNEEEDAIFICINRALSEICD
jgi:hypothetical protein